MEVTAVEIYQPRKSSCLASARVQLTGDAGLQIMIDDLRILQNKSNVLWVALPTYSLPAGRSYTYEPTVTLSSQIKRQVDDAVLAAYEKWAVRS